MMSVEEYTGLPGGKLRRIGLVFGSRSDIPQCWKGGLFLDGLFREGRIEKPRTFVSSIHRRNPETRRLIKRLVKWADVLVLGAGWANHLTGTGDAIMRNELRDTRVPVVGVAFRGKNSRQTRAAISSIEYVPGTNVIFKIGSEKNIGPEGFYRACKYAALTCNFPEIKLAEKLPKSEEIRWNEFLRLSLVA